MLKLSNITYLAVLVIGLLAAQGCNSSKAITKQAVKLEEAGMTEEAASSYFRALWKNRYNAEAQIGMKKTGQQVMDLKLGMWSTSRVSKDKKTMVYDFMKLLDYQRKIKKVGVDLVITDFYLQDFENLKIEYMHEVYEEGNALLEEGKYDEAEKVFKEISRLDPEFKDTSELKDIAYLEPLYADANRALEAQRFREAHNNFVLIKERKPDYKNVRDLDDEALRAGAFTLAVLPFENSTGKKGADVKAQAYVLQSLTKLQDPFLKIVDRGDLDHILEEQRLGMTGVIDEETATEVGALLGANAILRGSVLSHTTTRGNKQSVTKDGYEAYQIKRYNKSTGRYYNETKYKPVTYEEVTQRNTARASYQYRVVSLVTGEILASDIVEKELISEAHYILYNGSIKDLYPSSGQAVNNSSRARSDLRNMHAAEREVKTTALLADEVFVAASELMGNKLQAMMEVVVP